MTPITQIQLQAICDRINRTAGTPLNSWTRNEATGRQTANIGNYHIDGAYGGVSLHQMLSDGGGVRDVFRCGHVSKRELSKLMFAFIDGLETAREAVRSPLQPA